MHRETKVISGLTCVASFTSDSLLMSARLRHSCHWLAIIPILTVGLATLLEFVTLHISLERFKVKTRSKE